MPPLDYALLSISTLFTLINPIGISPLFLALTDRFTESQRKDIATKGTVTAAITLIIFALLGTYIFKLYSITLDAFRIMGGIIFFRSGLRMLESIVSRTRATPSEQEESLHLDDIAISPIGIPVITGPGAITAAMVLSGQAANMIHYAILLFSILLVIFITYLILRGADKFSKKLGTTGMRVIQRVMGIILMVIAVQFVINGITPVLRGIMTPATGN